MFLAPMLRPIADKSNTGSLKFGSNHRSHVAER
jgi:hypothetical protein